MTEDVILCSTLNPNQRKLVEQKLNKEVRRQACVQIPRNLHTGLLSWKNSIPTIIMK